MRDVSPRKTTEPAKRAGARDNTVPGREGDVSGAGEGGDRQTGCEVVNGSREGKWVKFRNWQRGGMDRFVDRGCGHVVFGFDCVGGVGVDDFQEVSLMMIDGVGSRPLTRPRVRVLLPLAMSTNTEIQCALTPLSSH